jgi:hypothetical protein
MLFRPFLDKVLKIDSAYEFVVFNLVSVGLKVIELHLCEQNII